MNFSEYLSKLLAHRDLTTAEATALMQAIATGQVPPATLAALAIALRMKGESVAELAAFASVMRALSVRVNAPPGTLDTCGTGGDGSDTFNISTVTALVVAGMGIPVAKHGGRSASSKSGSVDVLSELGVNVNADPACIARCISTAGIGFMFAQNHHPGMKHVAPVRSELRVRTVFNLLGPLANPAHTPFQLLGVSEPGLCEKFAAVLRSLGSTSAMVVCGAGAPGTSGQLDEISTFGPTTIARLHDGAITLEQLDPTTLGFALASPESLRADTPRASAQIIRAILDGNPGAPRDVVVLNAAAAARVAGKAETWPAALALAQKSIDNSNAKTALERLVQTSNHK